MRKAEAKDVPELAGLIRAIWPHDNPDSGRIARVILETNHVTLVETSADGSLIGFVDGFSTAAQPAVLRWEVDLLGVHPDHRGKGIATRLVSAVTEAGRRFGAASARALVQVDNGASLTTFQRCGFILGKTVYDLCVSDTGEMSSLAAPPDAHLISVATLTYSGVWIEGNPSAEALRAAQVARRRYGWDVAGAVLPEGGSTAADAGYELVGKYYWLKCVWIG